jgi:serine/threonine protein kinase
MRGDAPDMNDNVMNAAGLEPGTVVAGWRVEERLGVGGYGAAYRVESVEHPGTFCTLKLALNPRNVRAGREAALLLDKAVHPNVVRCHGSGRWPHPVHGRPFLVMELVPGLPLHLWVEQHNPDFMRLARVGAETALALGALHGRGVLHRDLKPEHILVREPDERPVLIDFGTGDYAGAETLTETPLPPGTTHLRSPEAACFWLAHVQGPRARYAYSPADELYALGACLYRAMTGHHPFPPVDLKLVVYLDIVHRVPAAPADVNPRVPRELSDIVMRLLAKRPEERFRSGEEVHAALVAASTFSERGPWDAPVFEWEEGSIRRPEPPPAQSAPSATRPLRELPGRSRKALAAALAGGVAFLGVATFALSTLGTAGDEALPRPSAHPTTEVAKAYPSAAVHEVAREAEVPDTVPAAAPPSPAEDSPAAAAPPVRHENSVSMKKQNPQKKGTPRQRPPEETSPATWADTSSAFKAALVLCLVEGGGAACTGAQLRPVPEDCPPEAIASMKQLRIEVGDYAETWIDITKPRARFGYTTFRDGPVVSSFVERFGDIPEGSVLFGRLYVSGNGVDKYGDKRVYGRWDKVKLTDGREFPVCFRLGNRDGLYENRDENAPTPPDQARFPHNMPLVAVDRFVYEKS